MKINPIKRDENLKPRERDGGLQPERTTLAWYRTVFVILVSAVLILRVGYSHQNTLVFHAGIVLIFFSLSFYLISLARGRKISRDVELTTRNAIWIKRYIAFMVGFAAIVVAISSLTNLYRFYFL